MVLSITDSRYGRLMTRLRLASAVLLLPVIAGCTFSDHPHPTLPVAPVTTATAAANSADAIIECGTFDTGTVYLNDVWPAILAGHPPVGFGVSMAQATLTWQKIIVGDAGRNDPLVPEFSGVVETVKALQSTIIDGAASSTGAPIEIGSQVNAVLASFAQVKTACANDGYALTQDLKSP